MALIKKSTLCLAEGKFNPQYDENDTVTISCSNILLSVGQSIEWGGLIENSKVEACEDTVKTMIPYVIKRELKIIKRKIIHGGK